MQLMNSQLDNFEQADAIPTSDLPATTLPWIILLIGVAAIIVAIVLFFNFRIGAILAIVLGVVVVASSVLLNLVDKAGAADDMNEAFKPAYTQELVDGSEQALVVVEGMAVQMNDEMLPALAQQLGMDQEQLGQFMATEFPATAQAMQSMPDAMGRFDVMVVTFGSQLENYNTIKDTVLQPIAWTVLIGGALILILGAWGLIDFGRSLVAPIIYAAGFVILFGAVFALDMFLDWGLFDYEGTARSWLTPFYYSVVTYTTLGYGDVTPTQLIGEVLVIIEVILGYTTLGLVLSILANKVARRS